ncbi:MAG: homocitrate synthase [Chloroflexi bacterium]|nr:homocitrate synthase [Chloroflexota bacterium]
MAKIHFIDVTNRDGVQTSRISLSKFQKTMLNWYLSKIGVRQSEAGFPFTRHEQNYFMANFELAKLGAFGDMVVSGWFRAIVPDVEAGLPTGVRDVNLSISTSDQMIRNKFMGRLDRNSVIKEMVEAVKCAKDNGIATIGINAEDGSRTDMEYLVEFALAGKEVGAHRIRYCDTVGCDTPHSIYERISTLADRTKMTVELHCHNDLGMAVGNSVAGAKAAVDAGVDVWINTTINGIGERAGQADLTSCILALKYGHGMEEYEIGDPIDLAWAYRLGTYIAKAFNLPVPINQVGIGDNTFAHESGIHADGALKDRHNYELYDYEILGRGEDIRVPTGRVITIGEYGGIAAFRHVTGEMGIQFANADEERKALELCQYANLHNQIPLTEDEIRFIAQYPEQVRRILTLTP